MEKWDMKIFVICPVRNATEEQKQRIADYIGAKERDGVSVYYSARDTDQTDTIGTKICNANANAIEESDEVHIFWDKQSTGSLFDLGIAWALRKPIVIINADEVSEEHGKSFQNVLLHWAEREKAY